MKHMNTFWIVSLLYRSTPFPALLKLIQLNAQDNEQDNALVK